MRARSVAATVCTTLIALTVLLRHHIRDLSEIARTYGTFYPFLERHPETLYRYSFPLDDNADDLLPPSQNTSELVPKTIHQIFLSEGRSSSLEKYGPAIESCKALHPDWNYNVWTDATAAKFMHEHYPTLLPHYSGYRQSIQRANILRYALLDHFGGAYLDLDITCEQPLDALRHLPLLTPGAYPAGVNNAFILSRPQHPFLQHLLAAAPSRDIAWGMPYVENMVSTGCMFFSNRWVSYTRSLARLASRGDDVPETDRVFILADAEGDMEPHMLRGKVTTPLFRHGGASSWHGWDAAAIVMIGKHYYYFLAMVALGSGSAVVAIWRMSRRSKVVRRRSWGLDKSRDEEGWVGVKQG